MEKLACLVVLFCCVLTVYAHTTTEPRGGSTMNPGTRSGYSHSLLTQMPKAKKDEVVNAYYSEAPLAKKDFGHALGLAKLFHGGVIFEFYNTKTKKVRSSYAVEFYAVDGVSGTVLPEYDPATKMLKYDGDKLKWKNKGIVDVVKVDMQYWTKKRQVAQIGRNTFNKKIRFYIAAYSNEYPIYQLFTVKDRSEQEQESTCVRFVFEVLKAMEESKVCVGMADGSAIERNIVQLHDALDKERVLDISASKPENRAKVQAWFTKHFEAIKNLKASLDSLSSEMKGALSGSGKPPSTDALGKKLQQMATALGNKLYLYNSPTSVREVHIVKDKSPVDVAYGEDADSKKWRANKCSWVQ